MGRQDKQRAPANRIPDRAIHLGLVGREVRDPAAVLQVLGVPKQHRALDLVLDGAWQLAQRASDDGRALAVPASHDGRAGALVVRHGDETLGFVDGGARGARGEKIVPERGEVRSTDALDPDVVQVPQLESAGQSWAGRDALCGLSVIRYSMLNSASPVGY